MPVLFGLALLQDQGDGCGFEGDGLPRNLQELDLSDKLVTHAGIAQLLTALSGSYMIRWAKFGPGVGVGGVKAEIGQHDEGAADMGVLADSKIDPGDLFLCHAFLHRPAPTSNDINTFKGPMA